MIWILIGIAIGVLLATGSLPAVGAVVASGLETVSLNVLTRATELTASVAAPWSTVAGIAYVCLAVMLPGVLAAVLLLLARATATVRRLVGLSFAGAGLFVLATYPYPEALAIAGSLMGLAGLVALASGVFLLAPLGAIATLLSIVHWRLLAAGGGNEVNAGAQVLNGLAGGSPELWRVALIALSAAPLVLAFKTLFTRRRRPRT